MQAFDAYTFQRFSLMADSMPFGSAAPRKALMTFPSLTRKRAGIVTTFRIAQVLLVSRATGLSHFFLAKNLSRVACFSSVLTLRTSNPWSL